MLLRNFDNDLDSFDPRKPIEAASAPPCNWYTDQFFYQQEIRQVFRRSWVPVGRVEQVEKPGQYFTGELADNPYVVARAEDGKLYAHHNVCRHKGAIVAEQEDDDCHSCPFFQCHFHGWQYHLNGKLKSAPMLGECTSLKTNPTDFSLQPISVDTWGPFVFLDFDGAFGGDGNPRKLLDDVKDLDPLIDFGKLRFYERKVYEMNCNWKVFVDNSLDGGYHVKYAHETLAGGLNLEHFETRVFKRSSAQICETNGQDTRLGNKVTYAYLFPNLFVNRYGNMMDVNIVEPLGVDKCRVIFDFYFDYDNFDNWEARKKIRQEIAASHFIQGEDVQICESVQKGMNSTSFKSGKYSSLLEKACHEFHIALWYEMKGLAR